MNWDVLVEVLKNQAPVFIALFYAWMNGKIIRAENKIENLELQKQIAEAHAKIDLKYSGMPATDVINAITSTTPPTSPSAVQSGTNRKPS